mgnify:FL=1
MDHKTDDSSSYLTLTSGTLTVGNLGDIAFTTDLLSNYGIRITGTDGGSLVLSGAATGLYRVQEEGGNAHEVNSYQTLSGYAGVVIGGGNFWRGVKNGEGYIERTRADHMGMLATAMNCMAVADVLEQKGVDVRVQTALEIKEVAEPLSLIHI